ALVTHYTILHRLLEKRASNAGLNKTRNSAVL
ncbi:unnamed protein product, partial [Allacma fusca]